MDRIQIVPGCLAQVHQIIDDLREADRIELALTTPDVGGAILQGWHTSAYRRIFQVGGTPIGVYGVTPSPYSPDEGVPWMVATPDIARVSREFLRLSVSEIVAMRAGWAELRNAVHTENKLSMRWLQWLGFRIGAEPVGPGGVMRMFSMPGLPGSKG